MGALGKMARNTGQARPAQLIDFLRRCYEADRQGTTLWNLFKLPEEKRVWIHERDPFLRDQFHEAAKFRPEQMKALFASAKAAGPAESLVYCPFWIRGKLPRPPTQKLQMVCSPLFMHPVTRAGWDKKGGLRINVDINQRILNGPLLHLLDPTGALRNALEQDLGQVHRRLFRSTILAMLEPFKKHAPDIRTDACLFYPEFVTPTELDPGSATDSEQIELMPFGACFLLPKSRASLGVLSELEALGSLEQRSNRRKKPLLSSCLRVFLGDAPARTSKTWIPPAVPVDLSGPQRKILESSSRHVLTQVVGPPGTGKTFTAAALVLGALSRGESVLIVSRQNQAVDVVYRMIEKLKGSSEGVLRAGRKGYLEEMRARVQDLLDGLGPSRSGNKPTRFAVEKWRTRVRDETEELERMEQVFARQIEKDRRNSLRLTRRSPLRPLYRAALVLMSSPQRGTRVEEVLDQLDALHRSAAGLIEWERDLQITELLEHRRLALIKFNHLLNSSTIAQTVERLGQTDFRSLLKAFPVWLVNAADLFDVLPMQSELFDLVIFDEASQCDIASSLPALQRAKRAVVIGDPEQLRHVSFLADKVQQRFADDCGLDATQRDDFDFRRQSLLDACSPRIASQNAVTMLDEHFRSHPDIIAFSNRRFYGDCLKVMTNTPVYQNHVALRLVVPPEETQTFADGVNQGEIETLAEVLRELIQSMRRDPVALTIGICSPFRNQVEAIRKRLEQMPRVWGSRHQIQVDTPHGFQGGERDIMLLSLALTHDAHATAFRYLGQGNVLNVALTRARSEQIVVTSLRAYKVPRSEEVLVALLEHLEAREQQSIHIGEAKKDPFLDAVKAALEEAGAVALEDFKLGGEQLDLHIDWDGRQFGIDLRGGTGPYHPALDLASCRRFRRAGIPVYTISFVDWVLRPDGVLLMARSFRRKHGIII